jgi:hypothetical protein
MTINILNKTKIVKKNINGKIKKCLKFLCFKCEEDIGNEFKIYKSEETENYVCEDCVPVAELLKRKKTEDKWANLTKKLLDPKEKKQELLSREISQQFLFEIFLKETIPKYPNWDNFKVLLLTIEDLISGRQTTQNSSLITWRRFYTFGKNKIDLDRFLYNFTLETKEDFGRELFDWATKKIKIIGKHMGLPLLTFASVQETIIIGRRLLQEWWKQFGTIQEVFDWLEGVEEIMLK